jgi:ABC-type transport system involved in cytochrome c biogenesis permease subunit
MRRPLLLLIGILVAGPSVASAADDAYTVLGKLAVQHSGRLKPLDTFARQMIKQVYTREDIKLTNSDGKTVATWQPLAAFIDWQARPEFWDDQEILAVEYPPLRQKLLSGPAREALKALADSGKLSATDKERVAKAAADPNVSFADLKAAAALQGVPAEMKARLKSLAHKIHPDQKWLSFNDLDNARLEIDGKEIAYRKWFVEVDGRQRMMGRGVAPVELTPLEKKGIEAAQKLVVYVSLRDGNPTENPSFDIFVSPRPLGAAYLKFTADAEKKISEADGSAGHAAGVTHLEEDAVTNLRTYASDLKATARHIPGADAEFDENFTEWLREKSAWVPFRVLLESKPDELSRVGFDTGKVDALKKAFANVLADEKAHPGELGVEKARAFVDAARDLGESTPMAYFLSKNVKDKSWTDFSPSAVASFDEVRKGIVGTSSKLSTDQEAKLLQAARAIHTGMVPYPSVEEMNREVTFNNFAPFYKAWMVYAVAFLLLLLSLGVSKSVSGSTNLLERILYGFGMSAFLGGIGLEIVGFYYRVRITGWAPVTNMYETVIWVALVASGLGLAMELIYRKTYTAVAASGVSLLATLLAANVSLLDPNIHALAPVLRSNYWLTIHVLTIVSSYAAFALAMGLGLLGIGYYLSATYRRDVSYARLALPLLPSLPMLCIGVGSLIALQPSAAGVSPASPAAMNALSVMAVLGLLGTIMSSFALIGELCSRDSARAAVLGVGLMGLGIAGVFGVRSLTTPTWWPDSISLLAGPSIVVGVGFAVLLLSQMGAAARAVMNEAESKATTSEFAEIPPPISARTASSGGGVATLKKPSVAEIRAREEARRPVIDGRSLAMQSTASRIKPLSNFIYRAMQVGVLLVAAGTILGGVWADVSWGRFWGWDAKEVWALITLLVYLVPLHGRFAGWVNTFTLNVASVACFASVLMAWYGVNFVLNTGLHTYGFVEGGAQGIVLTACLSVLAVVAATAWRRRLASAA